MTANKMRIRLKAGVPSYKTTGLPRMESGKTYDVHRSYWETIKYLVDVIPIDWRPVHKNTIKVLVPESMTSAFLIMAKIKDLCKQCHAKNVVLHIQERIGTPRRAIPMYRMLDAKISVMSYKMIPDLQVPRFGFLNEFHGYDYVFDPMVTIKSGGVLDEWMPQLKSDPNYADTMKNVATKDVADVPKNAMFLLMRNEEAQAKEYGSWGVKEWAKLINLIHKNYEVRLIGMPCDKAFTNEVLAAGAQATAWYQGRISLRKLMAILKKGAGLVSLRSGVAMMAASQGVNTTIIWPSANRFPFEFRHEWIPKGDGRNYQAMDMVADINKAAEMIISNLRPIDG